MEDRKKSVLVTGCSPGGIGHALAKEFHSRGFRVLATGRTVEKIRDLEVSLGIECLPLIVDDPESVEKCYAAVEKSLGSQGLDYLVNNAGVTTYKPAIETSLAETRSNIDSNYVGVTNICTTFLPLLMRNRGVILNNGSIAGLLPLPWMSVYCASKAAVRAYTNILRLELAPLGVQVFYLQTANVKTTIFREEATFKPGSMYAPAYGAFAGMLKTIVTTGSTPTDFAKETVTKLLGRRSWIWGWGGWEIWAGEGSNMYWLISYLDALLPGNLLGRLYSSLNQLPKVKASVDNP